jgi:hypothetical protein
MKPWRMLWAGLVAHPRNTRSVFSVLVSKREGKRPLKMIVLEGMIILK